MENGKIYAECKGVVGDQMRNEEIYKKIGVEDVIERIAKQKWKWDILHERERVIINGPKEA